MLIKPACFIRMLANESIEQVECWLKKIPWPEIHKNLTLYFPWSSVLANSALVVTLQNRSTQTLCTPNGQLDVDRRRIKRSENSTSTFILKDLLHVCATIFMIWGFYGYLLKGWIFLPGGTTIVSQIFLRDLISHCSVFALWRGFMCVGV